MGSPPKPSWAGPGIVSSTLVSFSVMWSWKWYICINSLLLIIPLSLATVNVLLSKNWAEFWLLSFHEAGNWNFQRYKKHGHWLFDDIKVLLKVFFFRHDNGIVVVLSNARWQAPNGVWFSRIRLPKSASGIKERIRTGFHVLKIIDQWKWHCCSVLKIQPKGYPVHGNSLTAPQKQIAPSQGSVKYLHTSLLKSLPHCVFYLMVWL